MTSKIFKANGSICPDLRRSFAKRQIFIVHTLQVARNSLFYLYVCEEDLFNHISKIQRLMQQEHESTEKPVSIKAFGEPVVYVSARIFTSSREQGKNAGVVAGQAKS